jgi:hypothetical protein
MKIWANTTNQTQTPGEPPMLARMRGRTILPLWLSLLLSLTLSACSSQGATPTVAPAGQGAATQPTATGEQAASVAAKPTTAPTPAVSQANGGTGGAEAAGIDLTTIDPCTLVPKTELETVFGELRGEPKPDVIIGEERGCTYRNMQGNFVDITLYPPTSWNLYKKIQTEITDVVGIGDEAFTTEKSDAVQLWVLLRDRVVVEVRISTHELEQAKQIAQQVIKHLP